MNVAQISINNPNESARLKLGDPALDIEGVGGPVTALDELIRTSRSLDSVEEFDERDALHRSRVSEDVVPPLKPLPTDGLLGYEAAEIIPSPTFGLTDSCEDQTIFVRTEEGTGLFRSQDGAATWSLLRMPLPWALFEGMSIQISPNYRQDRTLFVAGYSRQHGGLGVWRSTDAGGTWQFCWSGLSSMSVASMLISPRFGDDQSLALQTNEGEIYHSENRGYDWHHVTDTQIERSADAMAQLFSAPSENQSVDNGRIDFSTPLVRVDLMSGTLVHQTLTNKRSGSDIWTEVPICLPPLPSGAPQYWTQLVAASADPMTVYAFSDHTIWRTLDGGVSWCQLTSPEPRHPHWADYRIRALSVVGAPFGRGTSAVVGSSHGDIWVLDE